MAASLAFSTPMIWGTAISSAANAVGSIFTTKAANAVAKAQANIARENARTMELQAQYTLFAAETKIQHETMQAAQVKAQQKTALAANGVAMGTGSAAELTASTDIIKTINKNRIKTEAHAQAWGYRQKATDYRNQALMYDAQKQSVGLNFFTNALGGFSKVALMYAAGQSGSKTNESQNNAEVKVDGVSGADPGLKVDGISSAQPDVRNFYGLSGNYLGQGFGIKDNGTWNNPYGVNPLALGRSSILLGR